ncbi:MAG: cytochrome P450 [Deltaproteobacteria bacterium]|nr:MAG: cytochrome P450 [Deltaproteobacteria bacterium]
MKLSDIDLNDLDTFEKGPPHDQWKLLRNEAPVFRHAGAPGEEDYWCITKYHDLKSISKDPEGYSSEEKSALTRDPNPESLVGLRQIMLNMDPPRHRQYRAIVNKAFTPRMIDGLIVAVDQMVDRIIDNVCEKGECDFVEDLAAPLPMGVICEMMGVPEEDRKAIYELGNKMVGFDDPEYNPDGPSLMDGDLSTASVEMFMYAGKLKERYKNSSEQNLATALLKAEVDGHKLSEIEFNSFFMLLAIAGNETTRTVTTNGMWDLIRNPGERDKLIKDPSLIPTAVEEILRFNPAVISFRRTSMKDQVLRGTEIKANDKVILWYHAANRDEEVFDNVDTFDVTRDPNPHLSFGIGEHFCLGANLARMELQKIFAGLMKRLPDIELAAEPRRLRSNFINGVKEMRVSFTPTAKSSA